MKIIADKIVFGGDSIGKIDGKTVFIPFAIPGETLDIEIVESKKDYDKAVIKQIITPSEDRVVPQCKYYEKCGGCNMMHINPEKQIQLRTGILKDIFTQNGIQTPQIHQVSGLAFNYRSRFQLNNGGLSQKNGNVTIPVTKCLCAEEVVNQYFENTPSDKREKGRVHLFGSDFVCGNDKIKVAVENKSEPKTVNKKKIKNYKENHRFAGTMTSPENQITVNLMGKNLTFDIRGFFQSNLFVFEKVTRLIQSRLPGGKNILDMYSGCGSISVFLADKYENVILVEHNRDALVNAEINMAGKKHISYGLSGAKWVQTCSDDCGAIDACVIDPPRSGMEKEVSDYLCKSKIPLIFSLSCDPATQARDCAKLIKGGYTLQELYLLDFYPNTSHIESLAIFTLDD